MFTPDLLQRATALVLAATARKIRICTAESCTGGLVAGLLTEVSGSAAVFDRGFVTYSNDAKAAMLGVEQTVFVTHGAVSATCAAAMARGALGRSDADLAVSITGVAGPTGGSVEKPVGTVFFAAATRGGWFRHVDCRFGDIGRDGVRLASVTQALSLLEEAVAEAE